MEIITGKFHRNRLRNVEGVVERKFHRNRLRNIEGVVETRISVKKMAKPDKGP